MARQRNELSVHCALNNAEKSTDILPLGLNLDRRFTQVCNWRSGRHHRAQPFV